MRRSVATLLGLSVRVVQSQSLYGVDWFHLQDESGAWRGHMTTAIDSLVLSVEDTARRYSRARFGSAKFFDKRINDLIFLSGLTDVDSGLDALLAEFPVEWTSMWQTTKRELPPVEWPRDDKDLPQAVYRSGMWNSDFYDDPRGVFEPICWVLRRVHWDEDERVVKLLTVQVAGLPHYKDDNSFADLMLARRNLPDFSVNDSPYPERSIWPPGLIPTQLPPLARERRYASLDYIRRIILGSSVRMQLYYAPDNNNATPLNEWLKALGRIGISSDYLHYLPEVLDPEIEEVTTTEQHIDLVFRSNRPRSKYAELTQKVIEEEIALIEARLSQSPTNKLMVPLAEGVDSPGEETDKDDLRTPTRSPGAEADKDNLRTPTRSPGAEADTDNLRTPTRSPGAEADKDNLRTPTRSPGLISQPSPSTIMTPETSTTLPASSTVSATTLTPSLKVTSAP